MTAIVTPSRPKTKKYTTESFIERAIDTHGLGRYDYGLVKYSGNQVHVKIKCMDCGLIFSQTPAKHLNRRQGCPQCAHTQVGKAKAEASAKVFKGKATETHGDAYGYERVEYVNARTKVKILCKSCGNYFDQTPNGHLSGHGCPQCCGTCKLDNAGFIEKSIAVHGVGMYDYSLVVYINNSTKVNIKCLGCGLLFPQRPQNHIKGQGCPKCDDAKQGEAKKESCRQAFEYRARDVHGNKYSYKRSVYIDSRSKVEIECLSCGEIFWQSASSHLNGNGCPKCAKIQSSIKQRASNDEYIAKAIGVHGDKFDYALVVYTGDLGKIKIKCLGCGYIFEQMAGTHLRGAGCPRCAQVEKLTTELFISRSMATHGDKYSYEFSEYAGIEEKICIKCRACGLIFWQQAGSHMRGCGCPNCARKSTESNGAKTIKSLLDNASVKYTTEKTFDGCKHKHNLRFDFYLDDLNICIEYNGEQHYDDKPFWRNKDEFSEQQKRDQIKRDYCIANNIRLIEIRYDCKDIISEICQYLGLLQLPLLLR